MFNNYPNCNCPSCTQCQDCTQVTPTCNCTTTCTCTTEQFTEECPSGLQSTNCLIYTGDNLQNCAGDDYLFRGTNFNTFLSQLWDTVKCAAAPTTNTINYDGPNIRNCDNTATVVATGSSLSTALNNIWNTIKCWYTDLEELISERQPVWQGSYSITIGASQPAPFNNINTALVELAKYHFNQGFLILLEDGTYGINNEFIFQNFLNDKNNLSIESLSGVKENVVIKPIGAWSTINLNYGNLIFKNLTLGINNSNPIIKISNSGSNVYLENVKIAGESGSSNLFTVSVNASLKLKNCLLTDVDNVNLTNKIFNVFENGIVEINGGSFSTNKTFFSGSQSILNIQNSSISFNNLSALNLFVLINNSSVNINNTTITNINPSAFNSNAFLLQNSTLEASYNYNTNTEVITGFNTAFYSITSNLNINGFNKKAIFKTKSLCLNTNNSEFIFNSGTFLSYNYNEYSSGVYNEQSKVRIGSSSLTCVRAYTGVMGSTAHFTGNEFIYNGTYYILNPSPIRLFFWEDGGNTSFFYGNYFDFNNDSTGLRTSVQGTQFWQDDILIPSSINSFVNLGTSARMNADFSSVIYRGNPSMGITPSVGIGSVIY